MGVDDIIKRGTQMFEQNRARIEEALRSEKGEQVADRVLGGASDAIKKVVPETHHDKVDQVRENIDKNLGRS